MYNEKQYLNIYVGNEAKSIYHQFHLFIPIFITKTLLLTHHITSPGWFIVFASICITKNEMSSWRDFSCLIYQVTKKDIILQALNLLKLFFFWPIFPCFKIYTYGNCKTCIDVPNIMIRYVLYIYTHIKYKINEGRIQKKNAIFVFSYGKRVVIKVHEGCSK